MTSDVSQNNASPLPPVTGGGRAGGRAGFWAFLVTLFLGAFNDNVSKLVIMAFGTSTLPPDSPQASLFLSVGGMVFILPYLLFSSVAGALADRFSKKSVMVWTKVWEVVVMALGFVTAYTGNAYLMLVVLFGMGAQSAFFSPAKYGFLPETQPPERLSRANGATQMWTFLAIILGGWGGGVLSHAVGKDHLPMGMLACVAVAFLGTATSFAITPTPQGRKDAPRPSLDPLTPHFKTLFRDARRHNPVLLASILGNSLFWLLGTMAQLVLLLLAKNTLKVDDQVMGLLQAAMGVGIGAGCLLAGILIRREKPFVLVPLGGAMLVCSLLGMGFLGDNLPLAFVMVAAAGFSSGFYMLPLTTAIQRLSPPGERGRYLAASSASDCVGMILGSLFLGILGTLGFSPLGVLRFMGLLAFLPLPWLCLVLFSRPSRQEKTMGG
ncbi:MAG: MFS transporter [Oligosphaeraceae bacterium]